MLIQRFRRQARSGRGVGGCAPQAASACRQGSSGNQLDGVLRLKLLGRGVDSKSQYVYPLSPRDLDQNQDFLFKDNAYN